MSNGKPSVLLVCSPGGHLQQMLALEPAWRGLDVSWVTLRSRDVDALLADQPVDFARGPTNRSVVKLVRNLGVAWRVLRRRRPDAILSTGAALAVPFFLVGRVLGCRLIYVESLTRTETRSLTGRLVDPLAHAYFVQWPEMACPPRRVYAGSILSA